MPFAAGVPNRGTDEMSLDQFNQAMRGSDVYLNFMRQNGLPTDGRVRLSRSQQAGLERALAAAGMAIPGGMHIDQGGNLNQKNRLGRNVAIGAAAAGAALTGFGLAGMGPLGGALGGGTAASVGAAGAGAAGAGAAGAGAAGAAGAGGMSIGSILSAPALGLGVQAATSYFGNRSANDANRYNADLSQQGIMAQIEQAERELAEQKRQFDAQQGAALEANAAANELKKRELEGSEEDRAFRRTMDEYNKSLLEAREGRRARYQPYQDAALMNLGRILNLQVA
jgi:hypothetical protein